MTHYDTLSGLDAVIGISESPYGTYAILNIPSSYPEAATSTTEILRKRGYMVRLLTGKDNPKNADYLFGALPHPDSATLDLLSLETGLLCRTPEQLAQALGSTALVIVA